MKDMIRMLAFSMALGVASLGADAAKRFGGGSNLGKQRPAPTMKETPASTPAAPATTAAKPAQAAPASPAAPAAKPSFMQRWGGLLAGLGIGALLASMFGAQLGPVIGMLLMGLLLAGAAFMVYRLFASKKTALAAPGAAGARPQFAGIGSALPGGGQAAFGAGSEPSAEPSAAPAPNPIPGFEAEPFVRVAKTSFIRLQAANDAGDLNDLRAFTTPEMFAAVKLELQERGPTAQRTDVVRVDAEVLDVASETDRQIVSVRFHGLIREQIDGVAEPFDEVWHLVKPADGSREWAIAGIQQSNLAIAQAA
jgi:predicted lipid-binding transport protein (Tim44 family)